MTMTEESLRKRIETEGPHEVTIERIEALEVSDELKILLFDMTYHTSWVLEQVNRNKEVLKKILQHVDLHGDKAPVL